MTIQTPPLSSLTGLRNLPPMPLNVLEKAAALAWNDAKMLAAERKRINATEFRGAGHTLFDCKDIEVMVSGPAGTGKSVACLTRMHQLAVNNPRFRGLVLRNTRSSLTNTGLVTFEQWVLGLDHSLVVNGPRRRYRETYEYPNGAVIDIGGMDKPSKVLSSEYDVIYVQQAEELSEEAWETLITRLRNYRLPWQQIIGDCNPGAPTHWIKGRVKSGAMRFLESRHEDNPALWDGSGWTEQGKDYLRKLDALTGVRKRRLRYGEWVSAEGAIYGDYWDRAVHMVEPFPIPKEWPRYRSIDFGFTNPFVVQWWAQDPDGRLYLYRELYQTQKTVKDMADSIKYWERWYLKRKDEFGNFLPNPEREFITATVADWDAEDRATLEAEGITTEPADKRVKVGIEAVQHRMERAGDGKPRLFVLANYLVDLDVSLLEAKKPTCFTDEVDGYIWADKANKEEPVKRDDHACDAARYMIMFFDNPGSFGFSDVKASGTILVPQVRQSRTWATSDTPSGNRWRLQ